jgi:hypothetical protein
MKGRGAFSVFCFPFSVFRLDFNCEGKWSTYPAHRKEKDMRTLVAQIYGSPGGESGTE